MRTESLRTIEQYRHEVETRAGFVSCLDTGGSGPPAVFVHGVGTNAHLWRHVLPALADVRRCVAVDLPLHGRTPMGEGQDVSLPGLADVVDALCEALDLGRVDLVAHDTGGAVAQVLASMHPERLATLTLTNCEVDDNVPPKGFLPTVFLARLGVLARVGPRLLKDPAKARARVFAPGYQDRESLPLPVVSSFLQPVLGTRHAAEQFQRWILSIRADDLVAANPGLSRLDVPTLVVWGNADRTFGIRWAHRLMETIPGAERLVVVDGGRLFFPDERADELADALRHQWLR